MKAVVRDTYGSADLLEFRDVERPAVASDEVLVRVRAAGLDRGVWHVMTGRPYPIRLAGYGIRRPKTPTLGSDLAGVVDGGTDRPLRAMAPSPFVSQRLGTFVASQNSTDLDTIRDLEAGRVRGKIVAAI